MEFLDTHNIIIDSSLSSLEALLQNPESKAPERLIEQLVVVPVSYWSFDEKMHKGQIVVHKDVEKDIEEVFEAMVQERFPLASVIPVADPRFHFDDDLSMEANNTSAFNYRRVVGDASRISYHAYGLAVDINPLFNPYIKGGLVKPCGATYDVSRKGTIGPDNFLVKLFNKKGWVWGGDFDTRKDYQHFEKHLNVGN